MTEDGIAGKRVYMAHGKDRNGFAIVILIYVDTKDQATKFLRAASENPDEFELRPAILGVMK